jgi:GNAT superfamily N-acetyltransferase
VLDLSSRGPCTALPILATLPAQAISDLELTVTRSHITVRAAGESDVAALVVLWAELRRCGALNSRLAALTDDRRIEERVRRLLNQPNGRILVALMADEPVGMAMLTTVPLGALNEAACVQVEYTVVAESFRRRGVGRALMGAAACYAEDIGADQVTVSVSPMSREANRFYAQLGLTPLSVRRVAPASALRRRIANLDHSPVSHDQVARRPLGNRTGARTGMRAALRRMAIASAVAEQPHDA